MGEKILEVERVSDEELLIRLKTKKLRGLLPNSTREHVRTAQRELLLAFRSLVDTTIESLERKEKRKKKTKIEVE